MCGKLGWAASTVVCGSLYVCWWVTTQPQAYLAGGKGPWDSGQQREPMPVCWVGPLRGNLVPPAP